MKSPVPITRNLETPNAASAPPLFANLVKPARLADDVAGAALLVLGAIPAAFFLLLAVMSPPPPDCPEETVSVQSAPVRAHNASTPDSRETPL
jgi:hypothetical protein